MSTGIEHRECAESLAAYVLGALPERESAHLRRHLEHCGECRAELDRLRVAADALPASVPPIDPPPRLKARVMEIVEAEAELLRAAGEAADRPPSPPAFARRRLPASLTLRPVAVFATACLVLAAVIVLATSGGSSSRTIQALITSRNLRGVRASLTVRGTSAALAVSGLPTEAADQVDELWVQHGSAPPRPAGTFVFTSGSVQLARPVHSGDTVLVTTEPGRGTARPTTRPLIVVHI